MATRPTTYTFAVRCLVGAWALLVSGLWIVTIS